MKPAAADAAGEAIEVPLEAVRAFRLERQRLVERAPRRSMVEVASSLIGLQAQVASAGALSLGVRVEEVTEADVAHAVTRARTLFRAWGPRGTVHLHAARDLDCLRRAFAPSPNRWEEWKDWLGVPRERYEQVREHILRALDEGPGSRSSLRADIERAERERAASSKGTQGRGRRAPGLGRLFNSWGGVFFALSREGHVVFGPPRSNETTFVRTDRWWRDRTIVPVHDLPEDERVRGAAELLRRYLRAYAPATTSDFAHWAGYKAPRVRAAFAALEAELAPVRFLGRPHWILRSDLAKLRRAEIRPVARLLPHFDTVLLGHRDRSWLLPPVFDARVSRAAGWIYPTILLDGQVVGTWAAESDAKGWRAVLHPFRRLPAGARERLAEEARHIARFLDEEPARVPVRLVGPARGSRTVTRRP